MSQLLKSLCALSVWLLMQPTYATAGLFGFGDGNKVATLLAELDEDTMAGTMDLSPDGRFLAVVSYGNGGTDIWDLEQKKIINHMSEGGTGTWFLDLVRYSPSGNQLATCHHGYIDIYDTSTWKKLHSIKNEDANPMSGKGCGAITYTPNGKELIRLNIIGPSPWYSENNIKFYDTTTWQITRGIRTIPLKDYAPSDTANKSSQLPLDAPFLSTPDLLLIEPNNQAVSFDPNTISISKDGNLIALAGSTATIFQKELRDVFGSIREVVVIIDISKHAITRVIPGNGYSLDWSPDNIHIAFGPGRQVPIQIFDSRTGDMVVSEGDKPEGALVRYTPDGKYLIEKIGKRVEIWDGKHQELLQTIKAEPAYISVSQDSRYFAIGGAENNILDINIWVSLVTHPNGPKGKVLVYKLQ